MNDKSNADFQLLPPLPTSILETLKLIICFLTFLIAMVAHIIQL